MSASALTQLQSDVRRREAERCNALLANDLSFLEVLLHDDLLHVHTSGSIESKEQFLASMRSRLRYVSIDRVDYQIRLAASGVAIATGHAKQRILLRASGQEIDLDIVTSQVWVHEAGIWKQLHFQATNRQG